MVQDEIHKAICHKISKVEDWFLNHRKDLGFLIYSSFDLRDSGRKICPVDANIFPAGFNNICQVDKETAVVRLRSYLEKFYPRVKTNLALVTEEHTNNPYYWENIFTLKTLIEQAGYGVYLTFPSVLDSAFSITSVNGNTMTVFPNTRYQGSLFIENKKIELIINNNDFSKQKTEWVQGIEAPMNPPYSLGWHKRRKDSFFNKYNDLVEEFCELLSLNPNYLKIKTEKFSNFDIVDESCRNELADCVDEFLQELRESNEQTYLDTSPFVFIKNNSGTYGLGVTSVTSGDDIRRWNNKARQKMKAVKGGGNITEVIIQEGILSRLDAQGATSEPAIYMLGAQLAGGFLRAHDKKGLQKV